MNIYFLRVQALGLLILSILVTSCNGQVRTDLPKDSGSERKVIGKGQPKLRKIQGADEYQTISCALQDKSGNLWFCTTGDGVYRYDGKLFTQFTIEDGLCNDSIFRILQDKTGDIWFGSKEGISRYDGRTFTTIPIPAAGGNNFVPYGFNDVDPDGKNQLWSMMQDRSGKIWLGTTDGIYCLDGKSCRRFLDNGNIINTNNVQLKWTQCIYEDRSGNMWFGSWVLANEGLCRYDGTSITQFKPYGEGWVRSILEDRNGQLLVVTRHSGVCRYDGKNFINFTKDGGPANDAINTVIEDKAGNLWLGTELGSGELNEDGGLWRYDGKSFIRFTRKDGLCHNGVYSIVEDRAGNIWVGTRNTDLCRFDRTGFTSFSE